MRSLNQGNSYRFEFLILNGDNEPINVSNAHDVKYIMAERRGATTAYISKDLSSPDIEIDDEEVGKISIKITNSDTKDLPIDVVYHEVVYCDPIGNVTTIMAENVEIVDIFSVDC